MAGRLQQSRAASDRGDVHRDFLRVNPLGVTHGPAAQQAELEQDYKLQWHALEINQTGAQMLDDANALSYGNYSFLAPDKDGKDMPVKGFWTATFKFKKDGDSWKMSSLTNNIAMPPPQ